MDCRVCGTKMDDRWHYCPKCGSRLDKNNFMKISGRSILDEVFSRMRNEFKEIDKLFEKDIEAFDLTPWFKKPSGKGFSVKIVRTNKEKPKVSVKTFGNVDRNKLEEQILNQLGITRNIKERQEKQKKIIDRDTETMKPEKREMFKEPKITEEPETIVKRIGSKVIVDIRMSDVKSERDINIKELENSIEVKAIANDKAYFKILTKPPQYRLTNKDFKGGILHLEFS